MHVYIKIYIKSGFIKQITKSLKGKWFTKSIFTFLKRFNFFIESSHTEEW